MHIVMLGLSHQRSPVEIRGLAAIPDADLPVEMAALASHPSVLEAVILSTCNRTELYAVATEAEAGLAALRGIMLDRKGLSRPLVDHHFQGRIHEETVSHLFRVAAGLESQILGEGQILAQVKKAFGVAQQCRTCGPVLDSLFRFALSVGKRARTETAIAKGAVSAAGAALELARETLGNLAGRTILILGTGKIGAVSARQLASAGTARAYVASRTLQAARRLAGQIGGQAIPLIKLGSFLNEVDLILCCTGAPHYVLPASDLAQAVEGRQGRPLLIIDLSVPRNVDPDAALLPGVQVLDLDDLSEVARRHQAERTSLENEVDRIVAAEVASFTQWLAAYRLNPTICSLRSRVDEIRSLELARFWQRHAGIFNPEQQRLVAELSDSLLAKLLHCPLSRLKGMNEPQARDHAAALGTLFGLRVESLEQHHRRRMGVLALEEIGRMADERLPAS